MVIVPEAFKKYKQFINWYPVYNPDGSIDKIPVDRMGANSDAHNPQNWVTYEEAVSTGKGIGFVFTKEDPFFFIDIDKCLEPSGWSENAQLICSLFPGCFVEMSFSGKGLHIFGQAHELPEHSCKNKELGFDLYSSGRFAALTGWPHYANLSVPQGDAETPLILNGIIDRYFPPKKVIEDKIHSTSLLQDQEIIDKMLKSKSTASIFGKASVQDLWSGDPEVLSKSYPPDPNSHDLFGRSEADAALCAHLAFWCNRDIEQMDRIFRMSGLMRDKWEREDYSRNTINLAAATCRNTYSPQGSALLDRSSVSGWNFKTVHDQQEIFKGCVYIKSQHAAYSPKHFELMKPDQFNVIFGGAEYSLDSLQSKTTKKAWEAFTQNHGYRCQMVDFECFRPGRPPGEITVEEGSSMINTYRAVQTSTKEGDPSPFLTHLKKLLPVETDRNILISYLAAVVQHKGVKFRWAPVIQGVEGNGKTLLAMCLTKAVGRQYTHFPDANDLDNKFNHWLYGKILIIVEEMNSKKGDIREVIKTMVSNSVIGMQGKGKSQKTEDSCANFVFFCNHADGVLKHKSDRRYCILYTAQQEASDLIEWGMDGKYFKDLFQWLETGGYAIVNNFLQSYQIPDELNPAKLCVRAPITTSTEKAISISMDPLEQEIFEAVHEERLGFRGCFISSYRLSELFKERHHRVPPNRYAAILKNVGYVPHPCLANGRVNSIVEQENRTKIRLYVKAGSIPHKNLNTPALVLNSYLNQNYEIAPASSNCPGNQKL